VEIQIGEIATFLALMAMIAKILDWYLTSEEKEKIQIHISSLVERNAFSGTALIKAPLSILSKLLDAALGENTLAWKGLFRSSIISGLIMLSCLSVGGLISETHFSIKQAPWTAYDEVIDSFETVFVEIKLKNEPVDTDIEQASNIISIARNPITKTIYLFLFTIMVAAVGIVSTVISLSFSRKVARELQKTESIILISGALLLGLFFSGIIANLCIVILYTISSIFVLITGSLGLLVFGPSKLLGVGVVTGYSLFSWLVSPTWVKAIAIGAIIPSFLLVLSSVVSCVFFPFRSMLGSTVKALLTRSVKSEKGVLMFFATGTSLLSAAIIMVSNFIIS
jgi:hypothetical protein